MMARLFAWVAALFTVLAFASSSRADTEPVGNAPRDVPMAMVGLEAPQLPAEFETKSVSDWLTLSYPKGMGERVDPLANEAESFKTELASRFAQPILTHVALRLARSPEEMAELAPKKSPPPAYAVGVAYPSLDLVLLSNVEPRTYEGANLGEVFRHELVHLALKDAVMGRHVPLWFNEGISISLSGERAWDRWNALRDASLAGTLLPLSDLDKNFPEEGVNVAYAESADFVRFLSRDEDRGRFASLVERVRGGEGFDRAMGDAYGSDTRKLEYQWHEDLSHRFSIWPAILGGSALWVAIVAVLVAAYVKRRRKAKAILAKWAEEEAAEERARKAVVAQVPADEPHTSIVLHVAEQPPRIEHGGRWHTLH